MPQWTATLLEHPAARMNASNAVLRGDHHTASTRSEAHVVTVACVIVFCLVYVGSLCCCGKKRQETS